MEDSNQNKSRMTTNILVADNATLISILIIAVFVIQLFNKVLTSNRNLNSSRNHRKSRQLTILPQSVQKRSVKMARQTLKKCHIYRKNSHLRNVPYYCWKKRWRYQNKVKYQTTKPATKILAVNNQVKFLTLSRQDLNLNPATLTTSQIEAQRLNRAILNYDFIFLMIGLAATFLFVVETMYRVSQIYANSGRRKRKRRQANQRLDFNPWNTIEEDENAVFVNNQLVKSYEKYE